MDAFYQAGSVLLCFASIWVALKGHQVASQESEDVLRAWYATKGRAAEGSRSLMRAAGYRL